LRRIKVDERLSSPPAITSKHRLQGFLASLGMVCGWVVQGMKYKNRLGDGEDFIAYVSWIPHFVRNDIELKDV
jgi:hypothetical protein